MFRGPGGREGGEEREKERWESEVRREGRRGREEEKE